MVPISTLVETEKQILKEFPEAKVYVGSGSDFSLIIQTEITKGSDTYYIRHEFSAVEIHRIKDIGILFNYFACEIINKLKEKGFGKESKDALHTT